MPDTAAPTEKVTASKVPWTEAEKYFFLLQAIQQLGGDKVTIRFQDIKMPGRTPKALRHLWSKIRVEAESFNAEGSSAATPARRGRPTKTYTDGVEVTPKKRGREPKASLDNTAEGSAKRAHSKKEEAPVATQIPAADFELMDEDTDNKAMQKVKVEESNECSDSEATEEADF